MCGIAGIIELHGGRVDQAILARMGELIRHRGPDDDGVFLSGPVGLVHRRLSIIDLTTGHQPMSRDGLTVVFNGEIYNYLELRRELQSLGHRFETTSDTEVLLAAYQQFGLDALGRLNGMFAFVLYDAPQRRVLAARDHFGIKPLYLHVDSERLIFASEIKALFAHPAVSNQVEPQALNDYLTFQFVLGEKTLFKGIEKLPPATAEILDLTSGSSIRQRYWRPRFEVDTQRTENEFIEELRSLFEDSARLQIRSDVPLGCYLSGGLDSSLVTMLASKVSKSRLKTFSGRFAEGPEYDESEFALVVANACNAESMVITPTERDFVDVLPKLAYQMDEPAAGPGLFPQYLVSRLAAAEVKVCLGGQGGDEIFGGYARYLVGCLDNALRAAVTGGDTEEGLGIGLAELAPGLPSLREYVPMLGRLWRGGLFGEPAERYFRLIDRIEDQWQVYSHGLRAAYDRNAVFERFRAIFEEADTPSTYDQMLYFDLVTSLPALLQVEDRVSMAVSLESRVPLLDARIVDLVGRMPPTMKLKGGETKYMMRQAARGLVPARIIERRDKMGFPVPLQNWARGAARQFFSDVLMSRACRERGLFDPQAVARLMGQEAAFGRSLWGLLQIELWFQTFIDKRTG